MIATTAYAMLGVRPEATDKEVRRAFMMLARSLHPDVTDDADAAEQFKAVTAAYEAIQEDRKYQQFWQPRGDDGAAAPQPPTAEPEARSDAQSAEQSAADQRRAEEAAAEQARLAAEQARREAEERAAAEQRAAEQRRAAEQEAEARRAAEAEAAAAERARAEAEAAEIAARHAAERESEARIAQLFAEAEEARRAAEAEKKARRAAEESRAAQNQQGERTTDFESETARLFAEAEKARRAAEQLKHGRHGGDDGPGSSTADTASATGAANAEKSSREEQKAEESPNAAVRNVRVVVSPDDLVSAIAPVVVPNEAAESQEELFIDDGSGLVGQLDIPLADAVLGTEVEIVTPRGETRRVQVPKCTQTDDVLLVPGEGAVGADGARGDLRLVVRVVTPRRITDPERRFFEWLQENHPGDGRSRLVPPTR